MAVHRHSWIWSVLPPGSRRIMCIGEDPELVKTLRKLGFEVIEGGAPDAAASDGERPDAIFIVLEDDLETAVPRATAAAKPGDLVVVPVAGGDRAPAVAIPRLLRVAQLALSPLQAIPAELAGRRAEQTMRRSGLRVSRELTGDRARVRYGLGSGGWVARHRVPLGSVAVGTAGQRPRSVVEEAVSQAESSLGRPLRRRSAEVFESGKLALDLVDSEGTEYFLSIAAEPTTAGLARSRTRVGAVLRADPPALIRDRIMEPVAEGRVGPTQYVLEPKASGSHPTWLTSQLWHDCVGFLTKLHELPRQTSSELDLPRSWPDLDLAAEFLARHAGDQAALVERVRDEIEDRVGDLPKGGGHGDFWSKNLTVHRGRLAAVLDWEWAAADTLPMLDVMDLRSQLGPRRAGGVPPGRNLTDVLWPLAEDGGDSRLRFACEATGTPADRRTLEALTMAYWLLRTARAGLISSARHTSAQWLAQNIRAPLTMMAPALGSTGASGHGPDTSSNRPAQAAPKPVAPSPEPPPSDIIVLCYHAISEAWPSPLAVTPQRLESQLSLLVSRGYQGATFSDAVLAPAAPRIVAVTFDDAYSSVLELAAPILERLGLIGTVFVPTAFPEPHQPMTWPGIEQWLGGPHERELMPMSWDELRRLSEAGWEIGSHTCTHPKLTTLADDRCNDELLTSRLECETRLGIPCHSLAYPYGDDDERVIAATGAAGYATACTLSSLLEAPAAQLHWPRVGVYRKDGALRFRLKVSPQIRGLRGRTSWTLLASIRARSQRPQ